MGGIDSFSPPKRVHASARTSVASRPTPTTASPPAASSTRLPASAGSAGSAGSVGAVGGGAGNGGGGGGQWAARDASVPESGAESPGRNACGGALLPIRRLTRRFGRTGRWRCAGRVDGRTGGHGGLGGGCAARGGGRGRACGDAANAEDAHAAVWGACNRGACNRGACNRIVAWSARASDGSADSEGGALPSTLRSSEATIHLIP